MVGIKLNELDAAMAAADTLLTSWETEPECISQETKRDSAGGEGRKVTGYSAQYVFDAVNEKIGRYNWRYEYEIQECKLNPSGKSYSARVQLNLYILVDLGQGDPVWFTKGAVFGGSVNVDEADTVKGAVTDALKKALSLYSVGRRAMRGLLKAPKETGGGSKPPATRGGRPPATKPSTSPATSGTPPADGPPAEPSDPMATNGAKLSPERQDLIDRINGLREQLGLTTEQVQETRTRYLKGYKAADADINDLRRLANYLADQVIAGQRGVGD